MARTLAEKLLEEITRTGILEGHSEYAPIESKQDFSEKKQLTANNAFTNNAQNEIGEPQQGQSGPDVLQHPDFIKLDGLPSEFNPELPDQEEPENAHDLLLSDDAKRDKAKHKNTLKKQLELKDRPTQRPTHQPKIGNTFRPRPPGQ